MENLLIPITNETYGTKDVEVLKGHVRYWFQENGTLPFEHGFVAKTFSYRGNTYKPYMCSAEGVSARNVEQKNIVRISWFLLPKKTILKIVNECNRYNEYVRTTA